MGNAQSASSTRRGFASHGLEASRGPVMTTQNLPDALVAESRPVQTSAEEGGSALRRTVGRRRSLMRFPSFLSLRKKSSITDSNDTNQDLVYPPPSRRRWRAFSGLKNRPISAITDSKAPVLPEEADLEASTSSTSEPTSIKKGKEREAEPPEQETLDQQQDPMGSSNRSRHEVEDFHNELLPDTPFREWRDPQNAVSIGKDSRSIVDHTPDAADSKDQSKRPLTPIPTSALAPTPISGSEADDSETRSHPALVGALGSWLSGRPRENLESSSEDGLPGSGSHSQSLNFPRQSQTVNAGCSGSHTSALLDAPSRNTERSTDAAGSSPSFGLPPRPIDGSRLGRSPASAQDRRTLPPASTGTLVVVQGVVHTTDVRRNNVLPPSHPQTPFPPTRPRSSSSSPTLRPLYRRSHSRSPSRASTPLPQISPRRGRFPSLTNSLRQRSRPGTSSSRRSMGTSSWDYHPMSPNNMNNTNERTSEASGTLTSSMDNNPLNPETTSAPTSPARPMSLSDAAIGEPSRPDTQAEDVNVIDDPPLYEQLPQGMSNEEIPLAGRQQATQVNDFDSDGGEEESEAELSASSIEVLGALLSVATAATAASLVTGSTDPLFSSGLATTSNNAVNSNATPLQGGSSINRASSSIQDPGSPLSGDSGFENSNAEAAVNTRMRAAWESLRDRFSRARGRRGAPSASIDGREDPREQMLREMARAFNTGLGLDDDDDDDDDRARPGLLRHERSAGALSEGAVTSNIFSSPNESPLSEGGSRTASELGGQGPGVEGSFERFLHNLQVDLRTALSEDYAARRARVHSRDIRPTADTPSSGDPAQFNIGPEALSSPRPINSHERHVDPATSIQTSVDRSPPSPHLSNVPTTPRPATLELPSLPGDSETSTGGSDASHSPPQARGVTGQPGAGVNWWRHYRFPPMQLAPNPSTLTAGNASTVQPRGTRESLPTPRDESTYSHIQAPVLPADNPEVVPTHHVVPVIVVGLQSVPVARDGVDYHHHHIDDPPSPLEAPFLNGGSDPSSDSPVRERAWPLRAASRAFGRMNRRSDTAPTDEGLPPSGERANPATSREGRRGGRTYLIFVIGGYYPPNHSIVTGADDMNSFEALWELAELLGQVKPPVASKEDIENSGLEIIKASNLSDYEQAGKVASNTVERCLICLDDYEREDDLRLLSCRHIFHKQCVDRWLEQGRNNCPACRTRGVRTSGDDFSTSIPTSDNQD